MAPVADPDEMLIRTIQTTQDRRLLGALIEKYSDFVYNFSFRFLQNEADAADCSQEVFILVYLTIGDFRFKSKFSTWLYRVTMNVCLQMSRKRLRMGNGIRLDEEVRWPGDGPEEALERKEIGEAFQAAIGKLRNIPRPS